MFGIPQGCFPWLHAALCIIMLSSFPALAMIPQKRVETELLLLLFLLVCFPTAARSMTVTRYRYTQDSLTSARLSSNAGEGLAAWAQLGSAWHIHSGTRTPQILCPCHQAREQKAGCFVHLCMCHSHTISCSAPTFRNNHREASRVLLLEAVALLGVLHSPVLIPVSCTVAAKIIRDVLFPWFCNIIPTIFFQTVAFGIGTDSAWTQQCCTGMGQGRGEVKKAERSFNDCLCPSWICIYTYPGELFFSTKN